MGAGTGLGVTIGTAVEVAVDGNAGAEAVGDVGGGEEAGVGVPTVGVMDEAVGVGVNVVVVTGCPVQETTESTNKANNTMDTVA